jgi:hypothetical protein
VGKFAAGNTPHPRSLPAVRILESQGRTPHPSQLSASGTDAPVSADRRVDHGAIGPTSASTVKKRLL